MNQLGNHYRATASEQERNRIRRFYRDVLGCEMQSSDNITANIPDNIDLFFFGNGHCYGVEYFGPEQRTLSLEEHYLACWLEIKTEDIDSLRQKCLDNGAREITDFWDRGHFYFHAPGGQVFRLVGIDEI